ncbi:MAG TPA: MATE family efflux transporter [Candidatus Eisenbacteria bacterium]|nr:MATE family efflux transporter [Candidatus Eisenbacteria bacterium]
MQDLTSGSLVRHLLKTTTFMLVTMATQTLYFLVDLYWVGRLGREAVAAVGISGNLMFVVLAVTMMLGVGTTTLVAHAVGRKDHERALLVFNQSQVVSVGVGVLFLIITMAIRLPYANALSADAKTAELAAAYLLWFIPASAFQFAMVAMAAALRGTGNFKPGMVVQTATVILNMILAPILIFGWGTGRPMGVAGAAVATLVAVVVGTVWLATYFRTKDAYLHMVPADWKPQFKLWGAMLKIGLPAGAEFALVAVYLFVVYAVIRPFGAAAQAGFGIGMRILQAGFMPVVALGFAVSPVAGQNFGARKYDRVRETFRTAALISGVAMVLFAIVCHIVPGPMFHVFSRDPEVVGVGETYLKIVSWNFVASGIVFVASSTFQAIGNTVPSLLSSFARILVLVPLAIVMSRLPGFELRWIWYLSVAAVTLQVMLSLLLLRREFRIRMGPGAPAPAVVQTEVPA